MAKSQIEGWPLAGVLVFSVLILVAVVVSIVVAISMAYLASVPVLFQAGGYISLPDILITLLSTSGITVPLCIAYLTLGKGGDCFCIVAEHIRYYLAQNKHSPAVLQKTFLYWRDRELARTKGGKVTSALYTLYEFTRMDSWPTGEHIDEGARMQLLSEGMRRKYNFYFQTGEDRHGVMRYVWAVGASALFCFAFIFLIYCRSAGEVVTFCANCVWPFNFILNIATYVYLLRLIAFKADIKGMAIANAKSFCENIENDVLAATRESKATGQLTSQNIQRVVQMVRKRIAEQYSAGTP